MTRSLLLSALVLVATMAICVSAFSAGDRDSLAEQLRALDAPIPVMAPDATWDDLGRAVSRLVETAIARRAAENRVRGEFVPEFTRNTANWSKTASQSSHALGTCLTLTYSFVPDGTMIPNGVDSTKPSVASTLNSWLDGLYGVGVWKPLFKQIFDAWSANSCIKFIEETKDDGNTGAFPGAAGVLNTRGDIRISARPIDGNSNILAYCYFPNTGDMVLDASDSWYASTGAKNNNFRGFRNVLAHELGHALGVDHVCPVSQTKLMEPFVTTAFDGPQFDDVSATQIKYGDIYEDNDTAAKAKDLGTLTAGAAATVINASIDAAADIDFFKITTTASSISISVAPPSVAAYLSGPQNNDATGSCSAGTSYNPQNQLNLAFQLLSSNGTTVITTVNATAAGVAEAITNFTLPVSTGGVYYIRVYSASTTSAVIQRYTMSVSVSGTVGPTCTNVTCPSGQYCSNGACVACTCVAANTQLCNTDGFCSCKVNFSGSTCSACATGYTGATCNTCAAGFFGPTCDVQCTSTTCKNGGSCSSTGTCTCVNGYSGAFCDIAPPTLSSSATCFRSRTGVITANFTNMPSGAYLMVVAAVANTSKVAGTTTVAVSGSGSASLGSISLPTGTFIIKAFTNVTTRAAITSSSPSFTISTTC